LSNQRTQQIFQNLGFPIRDAYDLPTSTLTFPDGAKFRVEIPSIESPAMLEAVIDEAKQRNVKVHRISQGSGIMLLTDEEIKSMCALGSSHHIEICLFIGPRMSYDTSAIALSPAGKLLGWRHAGIDQLSYALEDIFRAVDLGVRSLLVADEGLIYLIGEAKKQGALPHDLIVKVSALMSPANPVTAKLLSQMGGTTLNIPGDLSLPRIASIRQVVDCPLDLYIESPDDLGGFIRYYEIPEIVRIAAPVYLKFGLRNAQSIYPSGRHLEAAGIHFAREKVRRASLGLSHLGRTQ
jgi:hypothetical protein